MRQLLTRHPDSRSLTATRVEVEVARPSADSLVVTYIVTGKMSELRIPPVMAAARSDELWRHTCFEAFVGTSSGPEYYEFNFAPSTQWAAYRFNGYRSGMRVADEISAPSIEMRASSDSCTLQASLAIDRLSGLPPGAARRLGLSAVVEDTSGRISYWALAHPPGKPDFHHMDCFTLELFPVEQP